MSWGCARLRSTNYTPTATTDRLPTAKPTTRQGRPGSRRHGGHSLLQVRTARIFFILPRRRVCGTFLREPSPGRGLGRFSLCTLLSGPPTLASSACVRARAQPGTRRPRIRHQPTAPPLPCVVVADLILVLDECTPFNVDKEYTAQSTRRSHRWAIRSLDEFVRGDDGTQALYGIIQGGTYPDLRMESIEFTNRQPFFGTAIGGSLGADKGMMHDVVATTAKHCRTDRPIHLLGIGGVTDIFHGVRYGIDTFDCVHPTRLGRHGGALVMAHYWEQVRCFCGCVELCSVGLQLWEVRGQRVWRGGCTLTNAHAL